VTRNVAYYIIAHAAKWVRPGSVRIHSNSDVLSNVAFLTANKQVVLIVLNDTEAEQTFNLALQDQNSTAIIPAGSVATFVWPARHI
jgi:glucosylceramidase